MVSSLSLSGEETAFSSSVGEDTDFSRIVLSRGRPVVSVTSLSGFFSVKISSSFFSSGACSPPWLKLFHLVLKTVVKEVGVLVGKSEYELFDADLV